MSDESVTPPVDTETAASPAARPAGDPDPLRGSRTSAFWVSVIVLTVVLLLLAIFILQNTRKVEISFLGWDGRAPLAASLLIAAVAGAAVVASAGALRLLQVRRRVKRDRRH